MGFLLRSGREGEKKSRAPSFDSPFPTQSNQRIGKREASNPPAVISTSIIIVIIIRQGAGI